MYFVYLFLSRLERIGEIPLCNGIAERAPHLFGWCFPFCYRCTFIYLFGFLTLAYIMKKSLTITRKMLFWSCLLCLAMVVDGGIQYLGILESTNVRRALTGSLFGIGGMTLLMSVYQKLEYKLLKKEN